MTIFKQDPVLLIIPESTATGPGIFLWSLQLFIFALCSSRLSMDQLGKGLKEKHYIAWRL